MRRQKGGLYFCAFPGLFPVRPSATRRVVNLSELRLNGASARLLAFKASFFPAAEADLRSFVRATFLPFRSLPPSFRSSNPHLARVTSVRPGTFPSAVADSKLRALERCCKGPVQLKTRGERAPWQGHAVNYITPVCGWAFKPFLDDDPLPFTPPCP